MVYRSTAPDSKYKRLWIVSAFLNNKKDSPVTQVSNVTSPELTSDNAHASPDLSKDRVQQSNDDVKYSTPIDMTPYSEAEVRDSKLLQKRVEKLQAINENLRNEFKLTKGVKLSEKAVRSVAKKLVDKYLLTSGNNQYERQDHFA